jgi:hypothetical protein
MSLVVNNNKSAPTLTFITMCKNEEHCIINTLLSVYKHIDYWIVCDTGSTDKTCEIVTNFFKEKNIPGELFIDEWKGFDYNKTLMFERAYNKTDYVIHLDADDFIVGNFDKTLLNNTHGDMFNLNCKRGSSIFKCSILYNNRLKWKYAGVAHNIILCLDKSNTISSNIFVNDELWVDNNERGARSFDPEKYIKDALKLKEQFFDTLLDDPYNLNYRSVFYTAQSYLDSKNFKEALKWYRLYTNLKDTWNEELFESHLRIAKCMITLAYPIEKITDEINKAINIFPDRAEPFFIIGQQSNILSQHDKAYEYLKEAKAKNYDNIKNKYNLFINEFTYGKYVNDELSVACYWTGRGHEGYSLLKEIINDDDEFFLPHKDRLHKNKQFFEDKFTV